MSLINEALRKARLEAARQDAAQRGLRYPTLTAGRRSLRLPLVAAAVLLMAIAGSLFYWLGMRAARTVPEAAAVADHQPVAAAEEARTAPDVAGPQSLPETAQPAAGTRPFEPPVPTPQIIADPSAPPPSTARPPTQPPTADAATRAAAPETTQPAARDTVAEPATTRPVAPAATPPAADPGPVSQPAPPSSEPTAGGVADSGAETFVRQASIPGVGDLRLGGIAWSERQPYALINGRVLGPGDRIQGLLVSSVEKSQVVLQGAGGATYVLRIR